MLNVAVVFGTRPEAIKMAPIIHAIQERSENMLSRIIITSQHKEMLQQVLDIFKLRPEYDLNIMRPNQDLFDISVNVLASIKKVLQNIQPDIVLVQGDTSSTFLTALAAFYLQIKVGHVEAGLRTYNKLSPFPEELNRRLVGSIADIHFAPTKMAYNNLIKENVDSKDIIVTGNTSIDSLLWVLQNIIPQEEFELKSKYHWLDVYDKSILITSHRRENFGEPLTQIIAAINQLHDLTPGFCFTFPVHMNPAIKEVVYRELRHLNRVFLIEPVHYPEFIYLIKNAYLILSDSGGVQEEAPSLGKPVLVLRNTTERPEGVDAGTNLLVGTDCKRIVDCAMELILNPIAYEKMSNVKNPFGDGHAATKIVDWIAKNI